MIDRSLMSPLDVHYFDPPEPKVDLDVILEALPEHLRKILSLESMTTMFQQSFTELLQDGEAADVVPESETVLLVDHSLPSPNPSFTTVQQTTSAPEVEESVCVPASALLDILDDFIADQRLLAPITSIAGYTDFKRQFDVLTDLLVAYHLLEPHVRDTYFAEALNLSPSDRAEIDAALAASYESDQAYPVALVDTILCQYFQPEPEPKSFLTSPPVYEPDEAGFALRQPPSCPLFDFTPPKRPHTLDADPASHAELEYILDDHVHLGSYVYNETKVSAYSHQDVFQHQSPLDGPITHSYDAPATSFSTDPPLCSLRHDIAPTVWLDLQPFADMPPTTVPISSSGEVQRSLEATEPVYVLAVAELTVSPLLEASVPTSKVSLRSLESDLAAAEHPTEVLSESRIPPCPAVAVELPPEHPPGLPFPPHYVSSPPGEISDSTIPPLSLQSAESDLAVLALPPAESPESPIPPPLHVSFPPGLQKLSTSEDTARSAAADGLSSLSSLFDYAKRQSEPLFVGQPVNANTPKHTPPESSESGSPDINQITAESVAELPPESVASIAVELPSPVPAESAIASPPKPRLAVSSPVPHMPARYEGNSATVAASEAIQHVRVEPEQVVVVVVVREEEQCARLKTLTPHPALPILGSPPSSLRPHANRLRACPPRFPRRSPHHLRSRTRLCFQSPRFCLNVPCARVMLAPRVRVPGSDPPPCSAIPSRFFDRAQSRRPSLVRPRTV
ncbi:hypothetical protein PENSPDRAFT_466636 [Peniophora sp. CONT]|nr:hypothetical protein PENSPDRAFT_466636 [Peniophora sp. CONT]